MANPVQPDEPRPKPDRGMSSDPSTTDPATNGHDRPSEQPSENRPAAHSNSGTGILIAAVVAVLAVIAYFMFAGSNTGTGTGEQASPPASTAPTEQAPATAPQTGAPAQQAPSPTQPQQ